MTLTVENTMNRNNEASMQENASDNIFNFSMKLKNNFGSIVMVNEMLAPYTTYKVGGPAACLVKPDSLEQLTELLKICDQQGAPVYILGGGSNLLISDKGLKKIVFTLDNCCGYIYHSGVEVHVGAGAKISDLVLYCEQNEISGLEFMSGIPGTVGGALRMNAGAFVGEIGDRVITIDALTYNGNMIRIAAEDAGFGYRRADNLQDKILTGCQLKMEKGDRSELAEAHSDYITKRESKQPLDYGSCGSVFKRPEGNFAGTLIEKAGCKGMRFGGAKVSDKHANFILNYDNARANDILQLIIKVQNAVMDKFNIWLEPEVKFVGFDATETKQIRRPK